MKNCLILIATVLLLVSCAKQEEIFLETSEDLFIDYFSASVTKSTRFIKYGYNQTADFYILEDYDYNQFQNYGQFELTETYFFPYQGGYQDYTETVRLKK